MIFGVFTAIVLIAFGLGLYIGTRRRPASTVAVVTTFPDAAQRAAIETPPLSKRLDSAVPAVVQTNSLEAETPVQTETLPAHDRRPEDIPKVELRVEDGRANESVAECIDEGNCQKTSVEVTEVDPWSEAPAGPTGGAERTEVPEGLIVRLTSPVQPMSLSTDCRGEHKRRVMPPNADDNHSRSSRKSPKDGPKRRARKRRKNESHNLNVLRELDREKPERFVGTWMDLDDIAGLKEANMPVQPIGNTAHPGWSRVPTSTSALETDLMNHALERIPDEYIDGYDDTAGKAGSHGRRKLREEDEHFDLPDDWRRKHIRQTGLGWSSDLPPRPEVISISAQDWDERSQYSSGDGLDKYGLNPATNHEGSWNDDPVSTMIETGEYEY